MEPALILQYGKAARRRRWRWWLLAIVAILCGCGIYWRAQVKTYWAQGQYLLKQRQCLRHELPADFIVFTDQKEEATALLSQKGRYDQLDSSPLVAAGYRMQTYLDIAQGTWTQTAFLHERCTPAGERVLVTVNLVGRNERGLHVVANALNLATWKPGSTLGLNTAVSLDLSKADDLSWRMYAGQIDPGDPTRFTIAYSIGNQRGTLEGKVTKE